MPTDDAAMATAPWPCDLVGEFRELPHMSYDLDGAIYGIASAPGPGARSIVRLSGAHVGQILECRLRIAAAAAGRPESPETAPDGSRPLAAAARARSWRGCWMIDGPEAERLVAVPVSVLYWPKQRSFTRQPLAEIHLPGSPPLVSRVVASLGDAGARPARPGEFTLRAFLAGRIDLTQAEAILGVIDAPSAAELRTALDQLAGGLGGQLHRLRESLLDLLAHLEAGLDFADEDLEFIERTELTHRLAGAASDLRTVAALMPARAEHAAEPLVALVGRPNVGKSSLFNALTGRSAIVADVAGTTRDFLCSAVDSQGVRFWLIDTAGIDGQEVECGMARPAVDTTSEHDWSVVREAQRQTALQMQRADLVVECLEADRPSAASTTASNEDHGAADQDRLVVLTKSDRLAEPAPRSILHTSAHTGSGVAELRKEIANRLTRLRTNECRVAPATAARCRASLVAATEAVDRGRRLAQQSRGDELIAAELRSALDALGDVVGQTFTDDILERIFSQFCIGK